MLTYGHHLRSAVRWLDVHDSSSRGREARDDVLEHLGELPHGGVCVHLSIVELSRELKLGLTDLIHLEMFCQAASGEDVIEDRILHRLSGSGRWVR